MQPLLDFGPLERWEKEQEQEQILEEARAEARAEALARAEARALSKRRKALEPTAYTFTYGEVLADSKLEDVIYSIEPDDQDEEARAEARAEALARALSNRQKTLEPTAYTFTYDEVLSDSKLKHIIYSIKPDNRRRLARDICLHTHTIQEYWWLIQIIAPITRLPSELLQQILIIIIDQASSSPLALMLVCKHWCNVVTSLWAPLKLGASTPKDAVISKLERHPWLVDVLVDTETDRGDFTPSDRAYEAIFTAIEATSRWRSFIVETWPAQANLPEDLVDSCLRRSSDAVMSRLRTFKIKCACEMSPLLERLLRVLGTTANEVLATVEINSTNVISILFPTYSSIFRSVTVLSLDTPGLHNPVDVLPHLHQLQILTASHLPLPVYHNDVNLPFIHTLRHLKLRSVSIQWMSGRIFHSLESCTLLFPLHHHVLRTFSATLPNCKGLTFEGYPLDILNSVSAHNLTHISVMCSPSYKPRGTQQLAQFSPAFTREPTCTTNSPYQYRGYERGLGKCISFHVNFGGIGDL